METSRKFLSGDDGSLADGIRTRGLHLALIVSDATRRPGPNHDGGDHVARSP